MTYLVSPSLTNYKLLLFEILYSTKYIIVGLFKMTFSNHLPSLSVVIFGDPCDEPGTDRLVQADLIAKLYIVHFSINILFALPVTKFRQQVS